MYGNPKAKLPLPALDTTTPYLIKHEGRVWLSSLGLAQMMGKPHTALLSALAALPISPIWRAENYRAARKGEGVRAAGLWISKKGFDLMALSLPREEGEHWRDVMREAFDVVSRDGKPIIIADEAPDAHPTGWGLDWFRQLLRRQPCT